MAFLLIVSGPNEGDYHPLGKSAVTIGRDEACSIQILDELVSRRHMQVRYEESTGVYRAVDDESANGVFINEQKIVGETPLTNGDVIRIGDSELIFSLLDFIDRATALEHYRRRPEGGRETIVR